MRPQQNKQGNKMSAQSSEFIGEGMAQTPSAGAVRLETSTCVVRQWRESDVASLVENANNKEVWRNLRDIFPHPYTVGDAEDWIAMSNAVWPPNNFAIDVGGSAVGGIGLMLQVDVARKSAEIGYWLGESYWGRGIVTEALKAVTQYGFKEFALHRIYALVFDGNVGSAKVLEKAGFELEGRLRKAVVKEEKILDEMLYAMVR